MYVNMYLQFYVFMYLHILVLKYDFTDVNIERENFGKKRSGSKMKWII